MHRRREASGVAWSWESVTKRQVDKGSRPRGLPDDGRDWAGASGPETQRGPAAVLSSSLASPGREAGDTAQILVGS